MFDKWFCNAHMLSNCLNTTGHFHGTVTANGPHDVQQTLLLSRTGMARHNLSLLKVVLCIKAALTEILLMYHRPSVCLLGLTFSPCREISTTPLTLSGSEVEVATRQQNPSLVYFSFSCRADRHPPCNGAAHLSYMDLMFADSYPAWETTQHPHHFHECFRHGAQE